MDVNPADITEASGRVLGEPEEIHIALVRPLGTNMDKVVDHLASAFSFFGFETERIKLSDFIDELVPGPSKASGRYEYYVNRMDAGDGLRSKWGKDTLSLFSIREVAQRRQNHLATPRRRVIYIYDSVMHPAEIETLRQTYGNSFFVISISKSERKRKSELIQRICASETLTPSDAESKVRELLDRDLGRNRDNDRRLTFEDTFYKADVFLDSSVESAELDAVNYESKHPVVRRFLAQLFSNPHGTPTVEEASMAHAFTASLRSSALSRRVGAALVTSDGGVIAVGRNDVPRPGGGLYGIEDEDGMGDAKYHFKATSFPVLTSDVDGADSNDLVKLEMLRDLFTSAAEAGVVSLMGSEEDLLSVLLASPKVKRSRFFEVIAYGRTVHAEMDAITTVARTGQKLCDVTLYVTTFPCHECARHIVASGIMNVVYVEPYPKSRVGQLHDDAVQLADDLGSEIQDDRVLFRPFTGIAPSRLFALYSFEPRKTDDAEDVSHYGHAVQWKPDREKLLRRSVFGSEQDRGLAERAVRAAEALAIKSANTVENAIRDQ
jgi:cytidine deaminase